MKTKLLKLSLLLGALVLLLGAIAPELEASNTLTIVNDDNETLTDVVAAFNNINPNGIKHPLGRNGYLQGFYRDTSIITSPKDHLQSVQRLKGNYFAISGSNNEKVGSNYGPTLFIVELNNDSASVIQELHPATNDGSASDAENGKFWHAGGMALLGDILAIPLEGYNDSSKVVFYDVSDPLNPIKQPGLTVYRDTSTHVEFGNQEISAGWVILTKLESGHYLLGVWSDIYGLDLYESTYANQFIFNSHNFTTLCTWGLNNLVASECDNDSTNEILIDYDIAGHYQNMNLVKQERLVGGNSTETKFYMIGTYRDNLSGTDWADLFEFVPGESLAESSFSRLYRKHMFCGLCDFDAGAGIYIADNALKMYGVGLASIGSDNDKPLPFEEFDTFDDPICRQKWEIDGGTEGAETLSIPEVRSCRDNDGIVIAVSYRVQQPTDHADLRISSISYGSDNLQRIECSPDHGGGYVTELWFVAEPAEAEADIVIHWEKNGIPKAVYDIMAQAISLNHLEMSSSGFVSQVQCNTGGPGNPDPVIELDYQDQDQIFLAAATTYTHNINELIPLDPVHNQELWSDRTYNRISVGAINTNADNLSGLFNFEWDATAQDEWPWSAIGIGIRVNFPGSSSTVSNPFPPASGELQPVYVDLTWDTAVPPNSSPVTYDVYLGTDPSSLVQIGTDQTETTIALDDLLYETDYYWRVDVIDDQGNIIEGEIWQFSTVSADILTAGYYEETDPRLTYNGAQPWLSWYDATHQASRSSIFYTYEQNTSITFDFYGAGLTIYRNVQTGQGNMEVCIDGQCTTVSNSYSSQLWRSPVSFTGLPLGVHQVEINNLSAGINLDAVEILNPQPLGIGRHENDSPHIIYSGPWRDWLNNTAPSQGSGTYVQAAGATAEFWIEGDELVIYRTISPGWGSFEVCIDGSPCTVVSSHAASEAYRQPVPFTQLGSGLHHVLLRTTSAAIVDIDAIEVLTENGPLQGGLHQESSELIEFSGTWLSYNDNRANGGTGVYSNDPTAEIRFFVEGDQFVFLRSTGPNRAGFEVCIDNDCETMGSFNPTYQYNQPLVIDGLGSGVHEVVIRNTSSSTSQYITFDAILIPEPLTVGVHQENNTNLLYYGNWISWADPNSPRIERYTQDNAARIEFSFVGDGLILRRPITTNRTPITVCIDNTYCTGAAGYSDTLYWDVPVSITNLGIGLHSVRIYPSTSTPFDPVFIDIEEVEILGPSVPLQPGQTYDPNDDSHFVQHGNWLKADSSSSIGGTVFYNNKYGEMVSFLIEGNTMVLYSTRANWGGILQVCIDDICDSINQYSPTTSYQVSTTFSNLGEGVHEVKISNGSVPIFTSNIWVDVEAIEVIDTP